MRPTKVKLFGHTIEIVWDKKLHKRGIFGEADAHLQKIFVSPLTTLSQQQATVLHEMFHIIWSMSGMKQRIQGAYDTPPNFMDFVEEEVARAFENAIFSMIKDNPQLFKWILNENSK